MATTLKRISQYLDHLGWQYTLDATKSRIYTAVQSNALEQFNVIIQLQENGNFFQIYAPQLFHLGEHPQRELIFHTLLSISWRTKMLQWKYDLTDGEIRPVIEFPLEDAPLTQKQFYRCLNGLVKLVDSVALPRIQVVLTQGSDPEILMQGERLLLTIQNRAPEGFLNLLESALLARRGRGNFASFP